MEHGMEQLAVGNHWGNEWGNHGETSGETSGGHHLGAEHPQDLLRLTR